MDRQIQSLAVCYRCQRISVRFDDRHRPVCREHDEETSFSIPLDTPSPVTQDLPENPRTADQEQKPSLGYGDPVDLSDRASILERLTDSQPEPRSLPVTIPPTHPVNSAAVGNLPRPDDREQPAMEPDEFVKYSHAASQIRSGAPRSQTSTQSGSRRPRPRMVSRPLPSQSQRRAHN